VEEQESNEQEADGTKTFVSQRVEDGNKLGTRNQPNSVTMEIEDDEETASVAKRGRGTQNKSNLATMEIEDDKETRSAARGGSGTQNQSNSATIEIEDDEETRSTARGGRGTLNQSNSTTMEIEDDEEIKSAARGGSNDTMDKDDRSDDDGGKTRVGDPANTEYCNRREIYFCCSFQGRIRGR